ncbi:hypothetical protein K458DRAFT_437717 [Lentithecium fluviatile CBS 122367]|uniref:Lysine-specific metallo-endopeptidase domain-containing protein n=1 Tax=Lentithecium fluviatile CBS 122367 TaxID=1168545 RepID=A0A6G1ICT3_9PLEO|nr:hypothetical protein K458DRAFT_437717 [Lentithecium fluviatile CBS 122367]
MLFQAPTQLFLCTSWFAVAVKSYHIDDSCTRAGIYQQVDDAMQSAFAMAQSGIAALATGNGMANVEANLNPARPPQLERLIKNVFAHDDIISGNTRRYKAPARDKYHMTLQNLKLYKVSRILGLVVTNMGQQTSTPGADDVTIYCDSSRLHLTEDGKSVTDADRNNLVMGSRKGDVYKCSQSNQGFAVAVTWGAPHDGDREWSAAIQLCKKTVENVKKGRFDNWGAFSRANPAALLNRVLTSTRIVPGFAQVDAFKLLDVTLLHEMTHARGAEGLNDVTVYTLISREIEAYRWLGITKLAKKLPYVEGERPTAPDNNSDSIAYFALGCHIMSDPTNPQEITDHGRLKRLSAAVQFP